MSWLRLIVSSTLFGLLTSQVANATGAELTAKGVEFFESKIRPVLVQKCYGCHSNSAKELKGGLALDTRDGIRKGGESGAAVIPGNVDESLLIQAIRYETYEMPPKEKLPDDVIDAFEKWVEMGAPDPRVANAAAKKINLSEARSFWSFKKLVSVDVPTANSSWPTTNIDQFVFQKLSQANLKPNPDSDRATLIRRISFDLTGLPPTPEEIEAFVRPGSSQTVADVVDRLLNTPQFGERWGRHWLDLVRYGESSGKERNVVFPYAWRYRNYVIDAFNADKPYNRFIREQVSGDLLDAKSTEERNTNLIATGFLAIGTKSLNEKNREQFRMDVVDEQIDVTTRVVMGVTVACARCHDHKFDPITVNDYYAMAGIFKSTEVFAGVQPGNNKSGFKGEYAHLASGDGKPKLTAEQQQKIKESEQDLNDLREKLAKANAVLKTGTLKGKNVAREKAEKARDRFAEKIKREETELKQLRRHPGEDGAPIMAVRDVAQPHNCRINIRGDVKELGDEVARGIPIVLSYNKTTKFATPQSGRIQLANWLVDRENPLTARVAVNRTWAHLFGAGIVDPPDNFGSLGAMPSHPELLDYLAGRFMENGWSVKKLIREIMLSRTYQLSSEHNDESFKGDPDNHLLWRMNRRRLEAESIRDSVLAVSGRLDRYRPEGSPTEKLEGTEIGRAKKRESVSDFSASPVRSVYLPLFRGGVPDVLAVFDMADPSLIVPQREVTTVATQALFMMNSKFVMDHALATAKSVNSSGGSDRDQLNRLYLRVLGRLPSKSEADKATKFVNEYVKLLDTTTALTERRTAAWATLCQTLMASGEFRYVY